MPHYKRYTKKRRAREKLFNFFFFSYHTYRFSSATSDFLHSSFLISFSSSRPFIALSSFFCATSTGKCRRHIFMCFILIQLHVRGRGSKPATTATAAAASIRSASETMLCPEVENKRKKKELYIRIIFGKIVPSSFPISIFIFPRVPPSVFIVINVPRQKPEAIINHELEKFVFYSCIAAAQVCMKFCLYYLANNRHSILLRFRHVAKNNGNKECLTSI